MMNSNGNVIPILLVIGGIIFLLVAVSKRVTVVEVSPQLRKLAGVLGVLMMGCGIGLYLLTLLISALVSLKQPTSSLALVSSSTPLPTSTATRTSGDLDGTLQGEINIVASEVFQTALFTRLETDVLFTATAANIILTPTANLRATAGVRLTQTQVAADNLITRTAIPLLTQRADNQTATATLWTATPTSTPSRTPIPTNTLFPTSSVLLDNVAVLFHDDFDRNKLSFANWESHGTEPVERNGRLTLEGMNRWGDAISRSGIAENEGVLIQFQYSDGKMELYLESGEYGKPDYRRWGFVRHGAQWEAGSIMGADYILYKSVGLREAEWHYLLLRVGQNGHFYMQLWDADDPSGFIVNLDEVPKGDGWKNRPWRFVTQVYSGTLELESYDDLSFPDDYVGLKAPVQLTSSPQQ